MTHQTPALQGVLVYIGVVYGGLNGIYFFETVDVQKHLTNTPWSKTTAHSRVWGSSNGTQSYENTPISEPFGKAQQDSIEFLNETTQA
jgi:hypothetical protein